MNKHSKITMDDLDLALKRATPIGRRRPPKPLDPSSSILAAPEPGGSRGDSEEVWLPILPLGDGPTLPEFDPDWLTPLPLRDLVRATSAALEVSVGFAAMTGLGFVSGAVTYGTNGALVEPYPGWQETTNLYVVCGLPSGTRKTQTYKHFARPIQEHEHLLADRMRADVADALSRRRADEKRLLSLEAQASSDPSAEPEREALARKLASQPVPALPRYLADDVTPEKLTGLLADHGGCMIIGSPEPDILGLLLGRYTDHGGTNLAPFLKGYDGEDLCTDRVKGGTVRVPRPLLTIVVSAQPEALGTMVADRTLSDRGFTNRCSYVVPRSNLGHRTGFGVPVPAPVSAAYAQMINGLFGNGEGVTISETPPRVVRFTPSAEKLLRAFWQENEATMAEGGTFHDFSGWASKLPGKVVRIAAVMSLASNILTETVEAEVVERAIHIGRFLQAHALATFGAAGLDPDQKRARRVLKHIENKRLTHFTKQGMWQNLKGGSHRLIARMADLDGGLDILESSGYIKRDDGNGRAYTVNPALWGTPAPRTPS